MDQERSDAWLLVACMAFRTRGTSFHLVAMGMNGGRALIADYLPRSLALLLESGEPAAEPEHWREAPYPVLSRTALGAERPGEPLFASLEREASGPRIEACAPERMPARAAEAAKPHPEEGLLLFSCGLSGRMEEAAYRRFAEGVAETLAPWEDRGFWAEAEPTREAVGLPCELRVHRLVGGRLESRALAELPRGEIRIKRGWDFLKPFGLPRPARITREEGPRRQQIRNPGPLS